MFDRYGNEYIQGSFVHTEGRYDVVFEDDAMLESPVYLSEAAVGEPLPWGILEDVYKGEGRPRVRANYALQDAVRECNALASRLQAAEAQQGDVVPLVAHDLDYDRSGWSATLCGFLAGALAMGVLWWFAPL